MKIQHDNNKYPIVYKLEENIEIQVYDKNREGWFSFEVNMNNATSMFCQLAQYVDLNNEDVKYFLEKHK